MNREQPRRRLLVSMALGLALLLLAGAAAFMIWRGDVLQADTPPLAGAPIGGAFELTDQDGARVSNDSLKGSYRLVYFGYSFCPDVCPVDVARMMRGFSSLEKADPERAARVQPIFITVDPERDTPAALKVFVAAFHPRLIGLTGSPADIETAKRAYRVYAAKSEGSDPENYLMDHTAYVYLMDPDGRPITYFQRDDNADAIAAGLKEWVR